MGTQESRRILICEDQQETAETLASLLHRQGRECRPSAAIIDIGLPDITGYGVAQFMRGLPFGSSVLLIAVTGKPAPPAFILEVLQDPRRTPIARQDGVPLNR